ncbi:MAG: hypothetical protein EOM20_01075 [Spartobacteria bacterium]|nr:hypothetical protein [Spartobacteria bacterium]
MKQWGIVLMVVGIVTILAAIGMAEGFSEDKSFIENASHMEVVFSAGALDPNTAGSEARYEGRLAVRVHYFIAAGAVVVALGLFMTLAARHSDGATRAR